MGAIALLTLGSPQAPATCTPYGQGTCTACTSCSSCKNCSKQGGSCTRCRGTVPPSKPSSKPPPKPPTKPPVKQPNGPPPGFYLPAPKPAQPVKTNVAIPRYLIFPFFGRIEIQRHLSHPGNAEDIVLGKVVAVQDGDTFTLLTDDQLQYKVRLYGIDAPEGGQAFGNRAKQALSNLIYLKRVTVYKKDVDRYVDWLAGFE